MRRIAWIILGCLMALIPLCSNALTQVKSARVYFVPWENEYRVAQNVSDIRKHPVKTGEIFDERQASSLVSLLEEGSWTESSMIKDVRLVIDIIYQDGTQESYIANRFEIFSTRRSKTRNIDAKFRAKFSSFLDR